MKIEKITASPPIVPTAEATAKENASAPLTAPDLPKSDAAKIPPPIAAKTTSDAKLREVLAFVKGDVSLKTLDHAVHQLKTHARQNVVAALKALRDGAADPLSLLPKDPLDFARAEVKEIAAKWHASKAIDFAAGVFDGVQPLPLPSLQPPLGNAGAFEAGRDLGIAIGLVGDGAAFIGGAGAAGVGALATPTVAGTVPGVALAAEGVAVMGASVLAAKAHIAKLTEPNAPAIYQAKALNTNKPAKLPPLDKEHVFNGEIKKKIETKKTWRTVDGQKVLGVVTEEVRKAMGYHLESSRGDVRIIEGTRSLPDKNGVYKAKIEIFDQETQKWIAKEKESTFFPKGYSQEDAISAVEEAFANAKEVKPHQWEGISANGMPVRIIIFDNPQISKTVFPLMVEP